MPHNPSEFSETPVIGDGVITIPSTQSGAIEMDLPQNVASLVITESTGNIQANNRDGRNIGTIAMGVLQAAMARNFDELGTIESRANSGIIATPVASPAVQQ